MAETRSFTASSPAKLNLAFSILGKLPDGYHEVETLMQAVDLEDEILFSIKPSEQIEIRLNATHEVAMTEFPLDESNLIAKAVRLFLARKGDAKLSVTVDVKKSIPMAAGMGGGSSNGASALLVLNRYFNSPFSKGELEEIGAELGCDVPFFIHGGVQIGRHKGEKLSAVPSTEKMSFLVVKPRDISVATQWIYKAYDEYKSGGRPIPTVNLKEACSAREDGNVTLAARSFVNVFSEVIFAHHPTVLELRDQIVHAGARNCCMTGSGPTLFGLCDNLKTAAETLKALKQNSASLPPFDAWVVSTIDRGPTIVEVSPNSVRQRGRS